MSKDTPEKGRKDIDLNKEAAAESKSAEEMLKVTALSGMYEDWFLDYASYVILERAVPHITDGLKPVQRRILHSMKRMDDGRFNKVANIIGHTMQFHPRAKKPAGRNTG
jgi:topoisomerase-4 subunit A